MCSTVVSSVTPGKVYTQNELVFLETLISEFHNKYYNPSILKLEFHFPHVRILGTHHCGKERCEAFKCRRKQHDVVCRNNYAERIVSSSAHQIQSEYYVSNRYVSIEGIESEHLSASDQASSSFTSDTVSHQGVFHSFLLDDIKQVAATTAAHSKYIMELLKNGKV